jgi:ABC-type Zn2+ transport system substrate-binding protein/surface adhesin
MQHCGFSGMLADMETSGASGSRRPALNRGGSHDHVEHQHGHDHRPGEHHEHGGGLADWLMHVLRPHSHEASYKIHATMEASAAQGARKGPGWCTTSSAASS